MDTQPVVIDREATDAAKLSPNSATSTTAPPAYNTSASMTAIPLGNGVVKYQTSVSSSLSAERLSTRLLFQKPHRLVSLKLQLLTNATGGTPDNFTGQVNFGKLISTNTAASGSQLSYYYFSTNGTPPATNNIVFIAGIGYEVEGGITYILQQTCPDSDLLLIEITVQYL